MLRALRCTSGGTTPPADLGRLSLVLLVLGLVLGCSDSSDDSISYREDIAPLFEDRCTVCHYTGGSTPPDLLLPFEPGTGLIDTLNTWAVEAAYPGLTPELLVVPGDPDASFLVDKIVQPSRLPQPGGGAFMPQYRGPLAPDRVAIVRQWIADGADPAQYASRVQPVFGAGPRDINARCTMCHYRGSKDPPDLTDPASMIGVSASYRTDLTLVVPGAPDQSYLVTKLEIERASSEFGAPMPYRWDPLEPEEVDRVVQWIVEGALDN